MSEYGLHSKFDIEQHKKTFVHYLEVLILEDGTVMYAVPSHQELAIKLACGKLGINRDELMKRCPPEYYFDFMRWLLRITNAIALWEDQCLTGDSISKKQIAKLRALKLNGLYTGQIPQNRLQPDQKPAECMPREELS